MNITECVETTYVLRRMDLVPDPSSIIGKELVRAYKNGYREYELFYEQGSPVDYILCVWTSISSYEDISKDYPEFFGYRYSCYLPTGSIGSEYVGSFCVWNKSAGEWVVYRPRLR